MPKTVNLTVNKNSNSQAGPFFSVLTNQGTNLGTYHFSGLSGNGLNLVVNDTVTSLVVDSIGGSSGQCTSQSVAVIQSFNSTWNNYQAQLYLCPNCTIFGSPVTVSLSTSLGIGIGDFASVGYESGAYLIQSYISTTTGVPSNSIPLVGASTFQTCAALCSV